MDLWQVGLITVIVVGFGLIVFGALWDRARNQRRARELLSPPPRTIPQFRPDAPAPHYLSDLQARRRRTGTDGTALTAEERERINRQIADASTVTVPTGYASRDFVTDATSGWAVLDHPAVLACPDPVDSVRELLPVLERLIMTGTPLVVLAPKLSAEVQGTLEVNAIQHTMRLLAVTPAAPALYNLAAACGADPIELADRQAGYFPAERLGRCERWVSTAKASHVIVSAEVPHPA